MPDLPQALPQWLNQVDFLESLGDLPPTFGSEQKLDPILRQVADTWFTDLVGAERVASITALLLPPFSIPLTEAEQTFVSTSGKFLGYAVWSRYVKHANVKATNTGLVTKETGQSEPITAEQRHELSRDAKAMAEHYALKLRKLIEAESCDPVVGSGGGVSFRTVRSGRRSRFN